MNTPRQVQHALLVACALASTLAAAQPVPQAGNYDYVSSQEQVQVSTTMIVLLAAVVAVFVFIAISTIYLRHCTGYHGAGEVVALERSIPANSFVSRRQRRPRGLDSAVIRTLPIMKYKEAKALQVGKVQAALECAVCLSEFDDDEQLRLLPKCSHAFHPHCIGQWLAGHVTCPVCRCNLDPNKETTEEVIIPVAAARETSSASSEIAVLREDDGAQYAAAVVIDVFTEEAEAEERRQEEMELQEIGTQLRKMRSRSGRRRPVTAQLVRSHSTGHSLPVRLDHDLERFTLRLPEHVRREMVAVGEQSLRRGRRAGEGSSRGGRNRRWPTFLSGTLSGKLPSFLASRRGDSSGGGEPSSSSSSSSTRVRGKRVAAVDAADSSAHGAVRLDCTGGSATGAANAGVVDGSAAATVDVWRR